jgi:hypothetical protein
MHLIVIAHFLGLALIIELPHAANIGIVSPSEIAASFDYAAQNATSLRMLGCFTVKSTSISRQLFLDLILQGKLVFGKF